MSEKIVQRRTDNVTFFVAKIDLTICPNTYEFFYNFRKSCLSRNLEVVFAKHFDRLLRNYLSVG